MFFDLPCGRDTFYVLILLNENKFLLLHKKGGSATGPHKGAVLFTVSQLRRTRGTRSTQKTTFKNTSTAPYTIRLQPPSLSARAGFSILEQSFTLVDPLEL